MYLANLQLFNSKVHAFDVCIQLQPPLAHICLEPEDLAIDSQARLNSFIDDSHDLLNGRTIVLLFRFVAFELL